MKPELNVSRLTMHVDIFTSGLMKGTPSVFFFFFTYGARLTVDNLLKRRASSIHVDLFPNQRIQTSDDNFRRIMLTDSFRLVSQRLGNEKLQVV